MKSTLLALLLTATLTAAAPNLTVVEDCCELEILTPSLQQIETRKIRLDNGLEALLISDPSTDQSGAALSIDVGSWQDPEEWPGQAHFTEHMVFLGNEQFPEENGLRRFLDEHGGQSNAYTAVAHTNYIFAINNNALPEALERFAAMFVAPLLAQNSMAREEHAVDQEFARAVENDSWRTELIHRQLNNPNHPDSRFGMGNLDTLGEMTEEQEKRWYESHYSANLMHLVVVSNLPLEEIETLVTEDFSAIPNRHLGPFTVPGRRRGGRTLGRTLHIAPYQNARELQLSWELPYDHYRQEETHSAGLLSFVLGHEGEGSLLAQLKEEGLAEWLSAGMQVDRKPRSDHFLFDIHIGLTAEGVSDREQVIARIFQAIRRLQTEPLPQSVFDETQAMARLGYERQTRSDVYHTLSYHARSLTQEPLASYPQKSLLADRFDPKEVRQIAIQLVPSTAHITLIASPSETDTRLKQRESYMGSEFDLVRTDSGSIYLWETVALHPNITLPTANPYLPNELALARATGTPTAIRDDDYGHLIYAPDTSFDVPEVAWKFYLKSAAIAPGDPKTSTLVDLYTHAVREHLNQTAYSASLAGLSYELAPAEFGVHLSLLGYSDKADLFLAALLEGLKNGTPTQSQFDTYRQTLEQSYSNASRENPIVQSMGLLKETLYRDYVTPEKKLRALEELDYQAFLTFFDAFSRRTYVEGILFGNLTLESAATLSLQLEHHFQQQPYPEGANLRPVLTPFPQLKGPFYLTKRISSPGNAAILAIDEGEFTFLRRAAQQILAAGVEEPFFSALRTHQQTGYVVWSWNQEIEHQLFQFFAVESKSHDGRDLLARFEEQIELFLRDALPEPRFDNIRTALIQKLSQPPKNPTEMAARLWELAFVQNDFDFIDQRIAGLEELTYPEFLVLSKEFLGKANKSRLGVLIEGTMPPETSLRYTQARNPAKIKRLALAN